MKMKFVNVTSDKKFGQIKHIVLQVEETDTFITSGGIDPGYKIIIDCTKHQVSAAGGHTFNPYFNEGALERSCKLSANESEVLGFYLSHFDDIDNLPDEVESDKFWNVVYSNPKRDYCNNINDKLENMYYNNTLDSNQKYYKVLYTSKTKYNSYSDYAKDIKDTINNLQSLDSENSHELLEAFKMVEGHLTYIEGLKGKPSQRFEFAIVNAKALEIVDKFYSIPNDSTIIDYIWCRFEKLPSDKWEEFSTKNDLALDEQC